MELRLSVWQFVRLMVHVEDMDKPSNPEADLLAAWGDIWRPLDAELAQLAASDADAFSEMMMDRDVVIEDASLEQVRVAERCLTSIMAIMDRAIEAGGDPDHLQDLKFERRELRQLARKLSRMG